MNLPSGQRLRDGARAAFGLTVSFVLPLALVAVHLRRIGMFLVDDAYISLRYARNLVAGHGLVYNPGERVEGYTNFFWTLLGALGIALRADPFLWLKCVSALAIAGCMLVMIALARRFDPTRRAWALPCLANWLIATSVNFQAHAWIGLEGGLFVFLLLLGVLLLAREMSGAQSPARGVPWWGVVFGLASLTRPEGPAFMGVVLLAFLSRKHFVRAVQGALVAAAIVALHLAWRRGYYGAWTPNTLGAKVGDHAVLLQRGLADLKGFATESGLVPLSVIALAFALIERSRLALACVAVVALNAAYVCVVGSDWMPGRRYLMPMEPFLFLLVDYVARRFARGPTAMRWAIAGLFLLAMPPRMEANDRLHARIANDAPIWRATAGELGRWMKANAPPGTLGLADIGEIGWITDWPIFDLFGLVTREVARLPGSHGLKEARSFSQAFYAARTEYFVSIGADCRSSDRHNMFVPMTSPPGRFAQEYEFLHAVRPGGGAWCIFRRRHGERWAWTRSVFDFEQPDLPGFQRVGDAFTNAVVMDNHPNQSKVHGARGGFVNSFHPQFGDLPKGRMESRPFRIEAPFLALRVGGGKAPATRVELVVDGTPVRTASGDDTEDLRPVSWDVAPWLHKDAVLRFVDDSDGAWGHLLVDEVEIRQPVAREGGR